MKHNMDQPRNPIMNSQTLEPKTQESTKPEPMLLESLDHYVRAVLLSTVIKPGETEVPKSLAPILRRRLEVAKKMRGISGAQAHAAAWAVHYWQEMNG